MLRRLLPLGCQPSPIPQAGLDPGPQYSPRRLPPSAGAAKLARPRSLLLERGCKAQHGEAVSIELRTLCKREEPGWFGLSCFWQTEPPLAFSGSCFLRCSIPGLRCAVRPLVVDGQPSRSPASRAHASSRGPAGSGPIPLLDVLSSKLAMAGPRSISNSGSRTKSAPTKRLGTRTRVHQKSSSQVFAATAFRACPAQLGPDVRSQLQVRTGRAGPQQRREQLRLAASRRRTPVQGEKAEGPCLGGPGRGSGLAGTRPEGSGGACCLDQPRPQGLGCGVAPAGTSGLAL